MKLETKEKVVLPTNLENSMDKTCGHRGSNKGNKKYRYNQRKVPDIPGTPNSGKDGLANLTLTGHIEPGK